MNYSPLEQMLKAAQTNGFLKPKVRARGLVFSLAPMHGKNPGCVYIENLDSGDYYGKIKQGVVILLSNYHRGSGALLESIQAIMQEPKAEMLAYGRQTGACSICNRRLDNQTSIDAGIGPICAEKYGVDQVALAQQNQIDWL